LDGFMPPSTAYQRHWTSVSPDQTTIGTWGNGGRTASICRPAGAHALRNRITARASTNSTGDIHIQYPNKVSVGFKVTGNGGY
jgi:hypothetical protein